MVNLSKDNSSTGYSKLTFWTRTRIEANVKKWRLSGLKIGIYLFSNHRITRYPIISLLRSKLKRIENYPDSAISHLSCMLFSMRVIWFTLIYSNPNGEINGEPTITSRPRYTQTFTKIEKTGSGVRRRSWHYIKRLNSSVQHSGWKDHDVTKNSYWKEFAFLNGEDEHVECSK